MQELDFLPRAQKGKISLSAPFIMLVLNCATKNISSYPHAPGVKNAARAPQRVAWKATLNKLAVGQEGALQLYAAPYCSVWQPCVQVMDFPEALQSHATWRHRFLMKILPSKLRES